MNDVTNPNNSVVRRIPLSCKDNVTQPFHYQIHNMECFDEMILAFGPEKVYSFCILNAWKYRYRSKAKGGDADLMKADSYLEKAKEIAKQFHMYGLEDLT